MMMNSDQGLVEAIDSWLEGRPAAYRPDEWYFDHEDLQWHNLQAHFNDACDRLRRHLLLRDFPEIRRRDFTMMQERNAAGDYSLDLSLGLQAKGWIKSRAIAR